MTSSSLTSHLAAVMGVLQDAVTSCVVTGVTEHTFDPIQ